MKWGTYIKQSLGAGLTPPREQTTTVLRLLRNTVNSMTNYIRIGDDHPTTVYPDAPTGSFYMRTDTGAVYVKAPSGWVLIVASNVAMAEESEVEGLSFARTWTDMLGSAQTGITGTTPVTYEAFRDTPWKSTFFRHDQNDELSFAFQMAHGWDYGKVHVHLHTIPMVSPAVPQVVDWRGYYCWSTIDAAVPALSGWTTFYAPQTIGTSDGFVHRLHELFDADPPASPSVSSILLVWMVRDNGGGVPAGANVDTYTTSKASSTAQANMCLLYADAHYQMNRSGSPTEYGP